MRDPVDAGSALHSVEAEQSVLGALLIDPSAWLKVSELITGRDFYRPDHQLIFSAIERLARGGKAYDTVLTFEELKRVGDDIDAGGIAYLGKLARETPTSENVAQYAEHVKQKSDLRQCEHADESDRKANGHAPFVPAGAINASASKPDPAARDSTEVSMLQAVRSLRLPSLHDVNTAEHAPKTPILEDLLYPGAWLVVGRPKIGKSWLLLQLALAVAENEPFLGYATVIPNAEVLTVFAEDDDGRIKSRLQALGVARAPQRCHVVNQQQFFGLAARFSEHMTFAEFLSTWLNQHPRVKLVIVDTETTVRQIWAGERGDEGGRRVTETDYRQTRAYDAIGLDRQIAIALVNHASKRKGEWTDIHELINRSNTALAGASGSMVLADPPDADPLGPAQKIRILGVRGRDLRDDIMLGVHQREEMPYFVSDGPYVEVRQTAAEETLLLALEELMADAGPEVYVSNDELAVSTGKNRGTVKRALTRMLAKKRTTWKRYRVTAKRGKGGGLRLDPL